MGDFIGTFPDYKDIPERFKKIKLQSLTPVACKFRLKAMPDGPHVGNDEFYGVRKVDDRKRLGKLSLKLTRVCSHI